MRRQTRISRADLQLFIRGHIRAGELIQTKKKRWLSRLSREESLRLFNDLWSFWVSNPTRNGMKELEAKEISFLIHRRRAFNKLAEMHSRSR